MTKVTWARIALLIGITAGAGMTLSDVSNVQAADHTDPPSRATGAGDATDIGDLYAWHTGSGADQKLVTALTFAGPQLPAIDQEGAWDPDALYGIHIDNDGDHIADFDIYVRFGQNAMDEWGIQVVGMPGEAGPVIGAVEEEISGTSGTVWAGLRDDPFFFDLEGFLNTLSTETLAFDATRDSFAGANVTTIVIEVPMAAALGAGSSLNIWATTASI